MNLGALRKNFCVFPCVENAKGFSSDVALGSRGKKAKVEKLWQELFSNPAEWRDHRSDKINLSFPDFRHNEQPHKALWLDSKWTPPWVESKLALVPQDIMQLGSFSWNQRLSRYAQAGQYEKIVELFQQMKCDGKKHPNKSVWLDSKRIPTWGSKVVAKSSRALESTFSPEPQCAPRSGGKKVEVEKLWQELFSNPKEWRDHRLDKVNPSFPDFRHNQRPHKALWLDSKWIPPWVERKLAALPPDMIELGTFSWNQRLSRYAQAEQYEKVVELFQQMQRDGKNPDRFTFFPVLKACSNLGHLELGRHVHAMMPPGFEADIFIGTTLVDMYAKCGSIEEAERVFKQMPARTVVTFNALIGGYAKCGEGQKALDLFEQMRGQGLDPNLVTFVGVLNACASIPALEVGRRIHGEIILRGYEADMVVGTCLVDMYAKCGSIVEAERVFEQMPTRGNFPLNAMISGYVKDGQGQKALKLFEQMRGQGLAPDRVTCVGVLNACASIAALEQGRRVHEEIIRRGYEVDIVMANCLVDMYAKCGSIAEAETVFKQMPTRNVVTLNAMIGGYAKCGAGQKSLELFEQMRGHGLDPDRVTFAGVLNACASIAALERGRRAHEEIIRRGYELDMVLGTSLVDMYAKCGSLEEAERVFNQMPTKHVMAWTALLAGYGIHGYARTALETFKEMCNVVEVNSVTFISLLSACSHGGLVSEGLEYFKSMTAVYSITPTVEHYACVVDLLGRSGRLGEAEDLIMRMPIDPNVSVWMALLGACRAHVNVQVGERCVRRLLELDPDNTAACVLLSNIYAAAGMFDSSARLNAERLYRGVRKIPGRTWIEVNYQVHSFIVDDDVHPQIEEIHTKLERLSGKMKDAGYVSDTRFLWDTTRLRRVNKEKDYHMCHHSEKLAIAFGLISTAPGTPLRIVKNLPACSDCHAATKFMAKMVGRVITVRDANRFHHFQDGLCSCMDYW